MGGVLQRQRIRGGGALGRWLGLPADLDRIVAQSWPESCGAAALATLLTEVLGLQVTEQELIRRLGTQHAVSLADLQRVCIELDLKGHGYALDLDALQRLARPALLHLAGSRRLGHFVVLRGIGGGRIWLADPARGNVRLRPNRFLRLWTRDGSEGRALFVAAREAEWLPLPADLDAAATGPGQGAMPDDWFPPLAAYR